MLRQRIIKDRNSLLKDTLCFLKFPTAFLRSHSNRISFADPYALISVQIPIAIKPMPAT